MLTRERLPTDQRLFRTSDGRVRGVNSNYTKESHWGGATVSGKKEGQQDAVFSLTLRTSTSAPTEPPGVVTTAELHRKPIAAVGDAMVEGLEVSR